MKGAFTGAIGDRKGRFELAGRGTLFLDEIGDTSPAFQAKLLRVLQEREFYPVGGERAAPHRGARHRGDAPRSRADGRGGAFREDLYFRLRVVEIVVPPLRERRGDIALLARASPARRRARAAIGSHDARAGCDARADSHDWPGNVRELENTLTRALVLGRGSTLTAGDLALGQESTAPDATDAAIEDQSLAAVERAHIMRVLQRSKGNKRQACRLLRISRPRLDRLLEKHGIR